MSVRKAEPIKVQVTRMVRVCICDGCKREEHMDADSMARTPKGWFYLAQQDDVELGIFAEWDACSVACLKTIAHQMERALCQPV